MWRRVVPCGSSGHCFPNILYFFQAFISCTDSQSVSHVLLWQPSERVHLIAMIVLCCSRKINMMMMMMMFYGTLLATVDMKWTDRLTGGQADGRSTIIDNGDF